MICTNFVHFVSFHGFSIPAKTEEIFKEAEPGVKYKDYVPSRFKPSSLFCGSDRVGTPTPESEHLNHSDIALRQVTKHVWKFLNKKLYGIH